MSRDHDQRLVEAGAIVAAAVTGEAVDTITARAYEHSALGDRTVVRLVPAGLGTAEDLAMEFLAFTPAAPPVDVGSGRRQALGFPAWALVNDPTNGHHALALVKDVERLSRLARTKPGNAKDGFEELAGLLGKAVPHFLPTFFEQAGRAFNAADNRQTAAVMFGKAREAERVHALHVDEDRQRDVFLEFAFSGALTAKSLTQHAKDLAERRDPPAAYELFLRICLERVSGGLAPYAGMAEDLRRLAKAAGLVATEQDERVVRALLDAPALPRAPLAFWKAYRPALLRLATDDVAVKGRLLDLLPVAEQPGLEEFWLALLEDSGAVAGLVEVMDETQVPRPTGGAAAWLERVAAWRNRGWRSSSRLPVLLALVERMAPRLRAEAQPVLVVARHHSGDLDLLDLCLSLDVPVRQPDQLTWLPVEQWWRDSEPGRRDLVALVGTAWAAAPLRRGLDLALQRDRYGHNGGRVLAVDELRPLLEQAGARRLVADWLTEIADDLETAALPGIEAALGRLAPAAVDEVFATAPAAAARLRSASPAVALARTLRGGVLDEFGWPALEQVAAAFPVESAKTAWNRRTEATAAWPVLLLSNPAKVVAVGPEAVRVQHDLRLPASRPLSSYGTVAVDTADDQVLVTWQSNDGCAGYWSGRPGTVFDVPSELVGSHGSERRRSLPLPDGGRSSGGRPLHAGDIAFSERRRVVTDGVSWWREDEAGWREYDPASGSAGRRSLPAFFEDGLDREGAELDHAACSLAVAPAELAASPLGTAGGLVGWRTVRYADGTVVGVGVDGRTVTVPADQADQGRGRLPVAALTLPDGTQVGLLGGDGRVSLWDGRTITSAYNSGDRSWRYAAGTPYVPPVDFWHALQARDPDGSAALRAITDCESAVLLSAGPGGVREVLPALTHQGLCEGIAGIVTIAQECAAALAALPEGRRTTAPVVETPAADDETTGHALAGLGTSRGTFPTNYYGRPDRGATVTAAVRSACEAVTSASGTKRGLLSRLSKASSGSVDGFVATTVFWPTVVGGLGAVALRAAYEGTPPEERTALLALLEAVAQTPLAKPDGRWRVAELAGTGNLADYTAGTVVTTRTGAALHLHVEMRWDEVARNVPVIWALERSSTGSFGAVGGLAVRDAQEHTGWGGEDRLLHLVSLVRERGPAPWRPEAVGELVDRTGLTRAEASLLLAGLPNIDSYEHNFLPKQVRETLGLKVTEAGTARPGLARLTMPTRRMLLGELMPDDPAALWDRGPDVTVLAETWVRSFGRRANVPEELVSELTSVVKHRSHPAAELLQALADPHACSWLTQDKRFTVDSEGRFTSSGTNGGFDGSALVAGTSALLWLAHRLPQDSPLSAALPQTYEALRGRLANPELLVSAMSGYDLSGFRQAWGHPPRAAGSAATEVLALGSTGVLVDREWGQEVYLRPSQLTGPQDPLLQAADGLFDPVTAALRLLAEPGAARLMASLTAGGSGWPQDPLNSAPDLVPLVVDALGVDEDAARHYLQLLAMPAPTDKHVTRWNGWTPAQLKQSSAALLKAGAVVEGKRARAGRSVFLPGGWLDVKAPMAPVESWKIPLLGLLEDGRHPLGVSVPTVPATELFRTAWQRVSSGEAPALETLRTGRQR